MALHVRAYELLAESPQPLPDDRAMRDARYAELAVLMQAWSHEEHPDEPDWEVEDIEPVWLPVPGRARKHLERLVPVVGWVDVPIA